MISKNISFILFVLLYLFLLSDNILSDDEYTYGYDNCIIDRKVPQRCTKSIATVDNLLIREKPGLNFKVIGKLHIGDIIEVHSISKSKMLVNNINDYWYEVSFGKIKGYVFGFYIIPFEDNTILNCERTGIIFFLKPNNYQKYNSHTIEYINLMKKHKTYYEINEFNYQFVKIINNSILSLTDIKAPTETGYYEIKGTRIFNSTGAEIKKYSAFKCKIMYSTKHDYVIIIPDKSYDEGQRYINRLEIINSKGKMIFNSNTKQYVALDNNSDYFPDNFFYIDKNEKYFIWSVPSKLLLLDLDLLKIEYYLYGEKPKSCGTFGSLCEHDIKEINDKLIIDLSRIHENKKNSKYYFNLKTKSFIVENK
jgi:hypothetical protein